MQPQFNCGITNITGIDLSPEMIAVAKSLNPHIAFDIADMLNLKYADSSVGAVFAFMPWCISLMTASKSV